MMVQLTEHPTVKRFYEIIKEVRPKVHNDRRARRRPLTHEHREGRSMKAIRALKTFGRLQAGEAVLIHAAGSGVGTAAVQRSTSAWSS